MTQNDHNFIHENLAAYLAGGLSPEERAQFDTHINSCPECFDAFTDARDADRALLRIGAAPGPEFEEKLVSSLKEQLMPRRLVHPMVKRAGLGVAAALLLGATGLAANHLVENDLLSNPISAKLLADASPNLPEAPAFLPRRFNALHSYAADDLRGVIESKNVSDDYNGSYPSTPATRPAALYAFKSSGDTREGKYSGRGRWEQIPAADGKAFLTETEKQRLGDIPFGNRESSARYSLRTNGRQSEVTKLMNEANKLAQAGKDKEAAQVLRGVLDLDESNAAAKTALSLQEEKLNYRDYERLSSANGESSIYNDGRAFLSNSKAGGQQPGGAGTGEPATIVKSLPSPPNGPRIVTGIVAPETYYSPGIGGALAFNDPARVKGGTEGLKDAREGDYGDKDGRGRVGLDNKKADELQKHVETPALKPKLSPGKLVEFAANTGGNAGGSGGGGTPATPVVQAEVAQRKIIRNGEVEFEVRAFDDAYQTVATVVAEEGGFVSSTSSDKLANGKIRGTIVVRVPPEKLDRLLLKLRALGELKSQQIAANDVTKQYTDLESELRALRAMEERLINLIKSGKGEVKDIIEAEKQLATYRVRIEKIEGEIRYYNNLVSMATLTVTAYEKDIQKPTAASEQENINMALETDDVESKYKDARKAIDDAKGRIVESELKKLDADQFTARIVCEVAPDKADVVAAQLRNLGKLARFDRDRKQTTSGGSGAPTVQVQQKETRFVISMYNLANVAPRETTTLTLAVRDVDAAYKAVLGQVRATVADPEKKDDKPAKGVGRVIASSIVGERPEQMVADVRADLVTVHADGIINAIRQAGEVLTTTTAENPDTVNVTTAKRGLQLRIVSSASVLPKETTTINLAARDVDAAFKAILAKLRASNAEADAKGSKVIGRVISSTLNGDRPEKMVGDLRADYVAGDAEAILGAIRQAGEVMTTTTTENSDTTNMTTSKRGLQLRIISAAAIAPRETHTVSAIAPDVAKAYGAILEAIAKPGDLKDPLVMPRIINSQLAESDAQNVRGSVDLELPREAQLAFEKRMADAGVDVTARNTMRSTDTANTLENKLRYQITLTGAQLIAPKRTSIIGVEVASVEKAVDSLRAALGPNNVRELDFNMNKEAAGRSTAKFVLDVPVGNTMNVLTAIRDLNGDEKVHQTIKNPTAPDSRYAVERIELTLASRDTIVAADKGVGTTVRAALSASASALLYSLYLVVTGVLFLAPWLLITWALWKIFRRKKAAATTA